MKIEKPRLIAFMNAYTQGKSGGDVVFIEVAKRIKNYNKVIITSLLGKKLCQKSGLRGKYLITTDESLFRNVILTYLKRIIKAFFLKLEAKKGDILLGTSDFLPDVLPIFWLKLRHKNSKWVQHIFHLIPSSRKIPFIFQRISFFFIRDFADLVVVDNALLKEELVRLGFKTRKTFVNHLGIDYQGLKSVKGKIIKKYDGIFMAQLRPSKGIFDLLKIWQLVCLKNSEAKLGIIGQGNQEINKRLKTEIKSIGLKKNIELLGFLDDQDAQATIKSSRIFIFPSYEEGFGLAALEAQALGLPVVAWNLPVFEEVFKGGVIKVKIGHLKEFSDEVLELLRDEKLYIKLSSEASNNASGFDWDKVAKRELDLIKKICQ